MLLPLGVLAETLNSFGIYYTVHFNDINYIINFKIAYHFSPVTGIGVRKGISWKTNKRRIFVIANYITFITRNYPYKHHLK